MTATGLWVWAVAVPAQASDVEAAMADVGDAPLLVDAVEVALVDGDCVEHPAHAPSVAAAVARANAGDLVVVAVDGELAGVEEGIEWQLAHEVDVVMVRRDSCPTDDAEGLAALVDALGAGTVGDAWSWGTDRDLAGSLEGEHLIVRSDDLLAVHRVASAEAGAGPVATADVAATAEWVWPAFMVFAAAVVAAFLALIYLGLRRDRNA